MQTPLRQIAENAGEDGAVIAGKILDRDEYNWGFDAQTGEFKDLVKADIVDPTKGVRTALQDARDRRFRLYWFGWSLPDRRKRLMHVADKRR